MTILWRRLDRPGHEACRLSFQGGAWTLSGTAVVTYEREACRLDYRVLGDSDFRTKRAEVSGWIGGREVDVLVRREGGTWWLGDEKRPLVEDALDVDLNFSPSTNLLPIRRLRLQVGQETRVRAAWLRFPGFELEPLEQVYRRLGPSTYRYESATGFAAVLEVDPSGFATFYPGLCRAEASGAAG